MKEVIQSKGKESDVGSYLIWVVKVDLTET